MFFLVFYLVSIYEYVMYKKYILVEIMKELGYFLWDIW